MKQQGFSLLELAIVVLIIGLIGFVVIDVLVSIEDKTRNSSTHRKMQKIADSLTEYYRRHGTLPCPSHYSISNNNSSGYNSYGIAHYDHNLALCPNAALLDESYDTSYGGVPFVSLGLREEDTMDGWKNRIVYIAAKTLIFTYGAGVSGPTKPTIPLRIIDNAGGDIAENVGFVLLSYGADQQGAVSINGGNVKLVEGMPEGALANVNVKAINTVYDAYVSSIQFADNLNGHNYMDDILIYRMPYALKEKQ